MHLVKINTDGTKVEATIGFYPSSAVDPRAPEVGGMIQSDTGHGAEVQATREITHKQFFDALKYVENNGSNTYNLNTYNCTDFGIEVAEATGWNVSSQRGTWPFGGGHNPGDLGEDLKEDHNGQVTSNTTGGNGSSKQK